MKKKRIPQRKSKLLFIVQLPPPVHGVSMMNKVTVESKLINREFDCLTLTLIFNKELKNLGKISISKIIKFISFYIKLVKVLIRFKPNLVYFTLTPTGPSFFRDTIIVWLVKLFNTQLVLHLHGKGIKSKTKSSVIQKYIYSKVFHNSHVIHLSTSLKEDLMYLSKPFFSYVLSNGIKEEVYFEHSNRTESKKLNILFLSNLVENKGVYTLLEAARILKEKGLSFKVKFVGKETKSISIADFNSRVKLLGLEDLVHYLGPKYDSEKNAILLQADIFAFPTYNDCFPLVLLEAMQAGLPVISTFEGSIPDIVQDEETGFIINYKDAVLLADKLEELIENPIKRKLFGQNAKQRFKENYTLNQYEKQLYAILQKINGYN